jgi:hypothetical protein
MTCETEGESVTIHEDPGWRPSLRGLWRHWIALVGSVMRLRARPVKMNGLIVLRSVFLALVAALLLLVVPLRIIAPWDGGDEGWVPWAVVVIGIASLAYVARIRQRPLLTTSPEALARYYGALFFIGVGVASAAALWGVRWGVPGRQRLDLSRRPGLRSRWAVDDRPDAERHRAKATRDHRSRVSALAS